MHIEIAAILTVAGKLEILEKLLDKRIERAALDTVSLTLPLLNTVYRLGEYKRLAANLAVMEHRLRCALGDETCDALKAAAVRANGLAELRGTLTAAQKVLTDLHVSPARLLTYKDLPLFRAECKRIRKLQEDAPRATEKKSAGIAAPPQEEYGWHRYAM